MKRDESELRQRLSQLRPEMIRMLTARTGSLDLAEETVQAALLKALEKLQTLQDPRLIKSWFRSIVYNTFRDQLRQQAHWVSLETAEAQPALAQTLSEQASTSCGCILKLLPQLRPDYAALLEAVDLQEQSVQGVARAWGLSANNTSVRLHRARQALKKQLKQTCGSDSVAACQECNC
jgi:RNA polymerase sigma factor (sigma-70 family)